MSLYENSTKSLTSPSAYTFFSFMGWYASSSVTTLPLISTSPFFTASAFFTTGVPLLATISYTTPSYNETISDGVVSVVSVTLP